jgi:hypothetical protein
MANLLQMAHIDLCDKFQSPLGWILDVVSEQIPVVLKRNDCKPTYRDILPNEKAWREALSVPFVCADGPDYVLLGRNGHQMLANRCARFGMRSKPKKPSWSVASW